MLLGNAPPRPRPRPVGTAGLALPLTWLLWLCLKVRTARSVAPDWHKLIIQKSACWTRLAGGCDCSTQTKTSLSTNLAFDVGGGVGGFSPSSSDLQLTPSLKTEYWLREKQKFNDKSKANKHGTFRVTTRLWQNNRMWGPSVSHDSLCQGIFKWTAEARGPLVHDRSQATTAAMKLVAAKYLGKNQRCV